MMSFLAALTLYLTLVTHWVSAILEFEETEQFGHFWKLWDNDQDQDQDHDHEHDKCKDQDPSKTP